MKVSTIRDQPKNRYTNRCQEDSLDKFSLRISEPLKGTFVKTGIKAGLVDVSSSSHQTTYTLQSFSFVWILLIDKIRLTLGKAWQNLYNTRSYPSTRIRPLIGCNWGIYHPVERHYSCNQKIERNKELCKKQVPSFFISIPSI